MRYSLRDDGYPFLKITQGRKWVGRVYKDASKKWAALINTPKGREEVSGYDTAEAAFRAIVSKRLGFSSAAALETHNACIRAKNRAAKARAQSAMDAYVRTGNIEPIFNLIAGKNER